VWEWFFSVFFKKITKSCFFKKTKKKKQVGWVFRKKNEFFSTLLVSAYDWKICEKISSASIPLAVLDNFYKLNCFLLLIFCLTVPITW